MIYIQVFTILCKICIESIFGNNYQFECSDYVWNAKNKYIHVFIILCMITIYLWIFLMSGSYYKYQGT